MGGPGGVRPAGGRIILPPQPTFLFLISVVFPRLHKDLECCLLLAVVLLGNLITSPAPAAIAASLGSTLLAGVKAEADKRQAVKKLKGHPLHCFISSGRPVENARRKFDFRGYLWLAAEAA